MTPRGAELLSLLVACALPAEMSLAVSSGVHAMEFFGDVGLAPRWLRAPLDRAGRRWISACVMARLGVTALAIPVSLRGARGALATTLDEEDAWSFEEGAFFGDIFADLAMPLPWFACQGTGPRGEAVLVDRVCTEEDRSRPGYTRCGMILAGSCMSTCRRRGGIYVDCRAPDFDAEKQVVTVRLAP